MNIHYHPSDETLLDYATGALGEAWSLAVATHLAVCPECRKTVEQMEAVAGHLVGGLKCEAVTDGLFNQILSKVSTTPGVQNEKIGKFSREFCLPQPLRSYAGGDVDALEWRRLGTSAHQVVVLSGNDGTVARLLSIPAGEPVPQHTHGGDEMTLVLRGAFEDHTGLYQRGDLQEVNESVTHEPHASSGEDCICLAVTDAPLRFKGMAARLLQPVIGI